MGIFNRFKRKKPTPLTTEEFFIRYPDIKPIPHEPSGVKTIFWHYVRVNGNWELLPEEIYWPSWAAWRFAQGSPEYVHYREVPSGVRDAHVNLERTGYMM